MIGYMDKFLVFIGASVVLVPIFHRLGLGSVLGYFSAGILVGTQGFKLIADAHGVLHFAELGVVLLLFMIGLEIQPRKLFPHLKIYARARNRGHAFELLDLGISNFKRETLDSSANFVGNLLVDMGYALPKQNS